MNIPYHDFGGTGEIIHLTHANGFPPGTYQEMVKPLLKKYHVIGMEGRALWSGLHYSSISSWKDTSKDLIRFLDENSLFNINVIGHSLGAVQILFAAQERPDLFNKVALIEPPLIPSTYLELSKVLPIWIKKKIIPPAITSLKRRMSFQSQKHCYDHFRSKKVFGMIPDKVLMDYVTHVTMKGDDNVLLRYPKEWEAHIFSTITDPWEAIRNMSKPSLAIRGKYSTVLDIRSWRKWQKHQKNTSFVELENGGHLIPLEDPVNVGKKVTEFFSL